MKLVKKLAAIVAVAAVCSSITVPVTAKASIDACAPEDHIWIHVNTTRNSWTTPHGYPIGDPLDNNYANCTITTTEIKYYFECFNCGEEKVDTETTIVHSDCGL